MLVYSRLQGNGDLSMDKAKNREELNKMIIGSGVICCEQFQ